MHADPVGFEHPIHFTERLLLIVDVFKHLIGDDQIEGVIRPGDDAVVRKPKRRPVLLTAEFDRILPPHVVPFVESIRMGEAGFMELIDPRAFPAPKI